MEPRPPENNDASPAPVTYKPIDVQIIQVGHTDCDHAADICNRPYDHSHALPACDTHTTGHGHGHEHHHHDHDHDDHHGVLKWVFSKSGADEEHWLQRHRSKIALGASIGLGAFEYGTIGALTPAGQGGMIVASALAAHDSSEDLMEAASKLKNSHGISGGVIGVALGAAHTASEFLMTATAKASQNTDAYSDMVVATTMGSNVSHTWLMVGVAGALGAVSVDRLSAWKMNALALGSMTAAFGYQVATGEFNPYLSAGMAGGGLAFLSWRVRAGQTCATYDHTGADHTPIDHKHDKDYVSTGYLREAAKKISLKNCKQALGRLHESAQDVCRSLYLMPLTKSGEIRTKLRNVFSRVTHPNLTTVVTSLGALGVSAHVMGNNVVKLADTSSISATAMGAGVAALAFALPELILTAKAALKKEGEMAWGAIMGCTVATVGIVGGYQGMQGFEVPASLSLEATEGFLNEGRVQMAAFAGSAATIIAATHPWVARKFAGVDNAVADFLKNKREGASDWLRNDGTKIPKVLAAPMVGAAMAFYAANTLPICHSHGQSVHCYNPVPKPLPSAEEANKTLQRAINHQAAPDF